MTAAASVREPLAIRDARQNDAPAITAIDARHTGVAKPAHWRKMLTHCRDGGVAVVAECGRDLVGYLLGEVRAWEFGSPPTGWIYAVGVSPDAESAGVGRRLVESACERFGVMQVTAVRTMVQRESIALLRFFRGAGFVTGPFVELERRHGT